ncbi:hypothetical protein EDB19DRAFT_1823534 [Suillus lakei]|nr:hypothetical protein EDB19DRAFT_1823534 [Suillus lakei]
MYEAYGKLIIGNEQRNRSISTMDGMHNWKLESGENLYGDIQKEKENGDEMEMSDGDGIGGRGSGMRNMTKPDYTSSQTYKLYSLCLLVQGGLSFRLVYLVQICTRLH